MNIYLCIKFIGVKTGLKHFWDFLLFGNVYVALGATCLVQSSVIQLQLKDSLPAYPSLVFFATLFVYNFQRIFYSQQPNTALHSVRRNWIFNHLTLIKLLAFVGFIGVAISFFYTGTQLLFYLFPLLILCLAYFIPFIKLRKHPFLKLLTLVSVWTTVTAVIPILLKNQSLCDTKNFIHICIRFCFMLGICIPFDIRDLKIDEADAISTLPQLIGENKTRWLAIAFMILYDTLIIVVYCFHFFTLSVFGALFFSAILNTVLVALSSSKRSEYFFVAVIDGTMILQGVLVVGVCYCNPTGF